MDLNTDNDESCQTCVCGRSFLLPGAFNYHKRTCEKSKKRLSGALAKAKEVWNRRKKQRVETSEARDGDVFREAASQNVMSMTAIDQPEVHANSPQINISASAESITSPVDDNENSSLAAGRPRRLNRRLPWRFRDIVPQALPLVPPVSEIPLSRTSTIPRSAPPASDSSISSTLEQTSPTLSLGSCVRQIFRTPRNIFGLCRQYFSEELPSHDPEENITLQDLFSEPGPAAITSLHPQQTADTFHPYPNKNSFLLGDWYWNHGIQKSRQSFRELVTIVGQPEFRPEDVRHTKWDQIDAKLASNDFDERGNAEEEAEWADEDAGWRKTPITISVPFHSRAKTPGPRDYVVGDLYHRSLISVIREKLANPHDVQHFHYEPFEVLWKPTCSSPDIRVHGELYTSPAFVDVHREVQELPSEPGCTLPRVVVAMMFWSDSTHLTSFGTAKLWPSYLFFGNESKYHRCKPTCHLCNHVAYFQSLPDAFKDFATQHFGGKGPSGAFMTHCRREVLHAQWEILLDDEFLEAYEHGIVITCCDGITRRFYPRIFTYSADYPEKILLASVRDKGHCPCPRCLIPLSRVQNLGAAQDMKQRKTLARVDDETRRRKINTARDIIYEKNYAVSSAPVETLLKEQSLVPTSNAFSKKLGPLGFNLFLMLLVDIMHEFELGVWRALFIHLLRMLNAIDKGLIHELDRRFRQVPTFGRDTIRRFSSNVSEMKRLAARDFEDLLQCAIPVFDGLFPEPHNSAILRLLFVCAHWHGMAKLRMHTDQTLNILDDATIRIGAEFRAFNDKTCAAFDTRELRRETEARKRRQMKKANTTSKDPAPGPASATGRSEPDGPRRKRFNLQTYKYHSLGDYATTIRRYGTTDSYSTEPGELEHRTPKARYRRTDRKFFIRQMAQIERRETRIRRIREKHFKEGRFPTEVIPSTPEEHHHIGLSQNKFEHIGTFLRKHSGDPAIKDFLPKLKRHLLPRVLSKLQLEDIRVDPEPGANTNWILFKHDRLYQHNLIRINYTTYDVRRSQDVVNSTTSHCHIMVLTDLCNASDFVSLSNHPFTYARVLGVYHVNVVYIGPGMRDYQPIRIEFLWVRWYHNKEATRSGWDTRKLDHIRFPSLTDDDAFGFIDPSDVLRSCHVIPAFAKGRVHVDGKGLSSCAKDATDWGAYYINRFVDSDMLMRYHYGLGVGHTYAQRQTTSDSGFYQTNPEGTESQAELDCDMSNLDQSYDDLQKVTTDDESDFDQHSENSDMDYDSDDDSDIMASDDSSDSAFLVIHDMYST